MDIFYISVIICKCYNLITTIPSLLISDIHLELRGADGQDHLFQGPRLPTGRGKTSRHGTSAGVEADSFGSYSGGHLKLRADFQVKRTECNVAVEG